MTEKFTPAPWFADNTLIDSDEHSIALVFTPDFPNEEKADLIATANANLISTAPDLYRELEKAVAIIKSEYPEEQYEEYGVTRMEAVLLKSRGE